LEPGDRFRRTNDEIKNDQHRCTVIKRNGKRCKLYTVDGEETCLTHGTANLRLARANLSRLQNPIVDILSNYILQEGPPCALCGHGAMTRERLRAIEMVMDRGGLSAKIEHVHTGELTINHEMVVERMTDDELKVVDEIMDRVMKRVAEEEGMTVGD